MGICVEKLPHSCGTSDALQVYQKDDGSYDGYCWACNTFVSDPYTDAGDGKEPPKPRPKKTPEQVKAEIEEASGLPFLDVKHRKLDKETLEYFGIRVAVSEHDGVTPEARYYPYYGKDGELCGYKVKLDIPGAQKRMWAVGTVKGAHLFGWQQAVATGAKNLYITEGEDDAAALFQALKSKSKGGAYAHYNPAVVSLKDGAGSAKKAITDNLAAIRAKFKEVVLVFDKDEAGQKATQDALMVLPTAKTVDLPGKDANDCVVQGRSIALANAVLFQKTEKKNTRIVWATSLYEAGRMRPQPGVPWPWEGVTKKTRGIRTGETIYLGAGVKMGKSEIVNSLAAHLMTEVGWPVFLAKPEEANAKTVKMVCGKVAGTFFHDPEVPFDNEAYDRAYNKISDKLALLDLYQHLGWESLRADMMKAVNDGCRAVFIDPITNLTNGVHSGEANTKLQEVAQELSAMAKDLDIVVFIFCHLKAPESGEAHERGGKVLSHQFAGSRAMMRSCNMMFGLEGNKDPDLEDEARNMRKLVLLEDREFGASGFVRLYWDKNTGLFNEVK